MIYGFSDVAGPNDWSHEGIDYCVRRSLMVGTGAGTFSPGMNCSRAQIVQILYNLSGDKTDYSRYYLPFTDVAPGAWYYDAVAWAYFNNVVSGTSETTFAPNDVITREQMAVILYGYTAEFAPEFTGNAASLNTFPDAGSVANWAYAAMSWAVGNGLISGMGSGGVSYLAPKPARAWRCPADSAGQCRCRRPYRRSARARPHPPARPAPSRICCRCPGSGSGPQASMCAPASGPGLHIP